MRFSRSVNIGVMVLTSAAWGHGKAIPDLKPEANAGREEEAENKPGMI